MSSETATSAGKEVLHLSDLPTPAFVINRQALLRNCRRVRSHAAKNGIAKLRPHIKTHKTAEGAFVQAFGRLPGSVCAENPGGEDVEKGAEIVGFVASTLPEIDMILAASTKYSSQISTLLSRGGSNPFKDVLYGVPISKSKLARIDALNKAGLSVHVLIDHPDQLQACEEYVERSRLESRLAPPGGGGGNGGGASDTTPYFTAFLKLDTGYHRAGVPRTQYGLDLASRLMTSKSVKLRGVYSHCGHAYAASSARELDEIARSDVGTMRAFLSDLVAHMESMGWGEYARLRVPNLIVSAGSTPSLFHHSNVARGGDGDGGGAVGVKLELHPGNYTLFDRQQLHIGSCPSEHDIAGTVLASVIGHYPDRNTILLDAGALALSKDGTPQGGACAIAGRDDLECVASSQEVTIVRLRQRFSEGEGEDNDANGSYNAGVQERFPFDEFPLGSRVRLLPNHSCLAAACFDRYHIVDEDEEEALVASGRVLDDVEVVDQWVPARGW